MVDARELRRHVRVPVSLPVALRVSYPSGDALRRDYVSNLSSGGMFVRTRSPLPAGTEVVLEIALADEPHGQPIVVQGRVVWEKLCEPQKAQGAEGFGVRFVGPLDPRLEALIARGGR